MLDNVLVEKSVVGRMVDVHVVRGAGGGVSDHFVVVAKVKWGVDFKRRKEQGQWREVIKVSELSRRGKEQEYAKKVSMAYERISNRKLGVWRRSGRYLGRQC